MGTWGHAQSPPGRRAIPCKWVFKRKLNADGSIERYKARLVLKGFRQRYGVDHDAVFAPVVRASTVRLFFSVVASHDLECHAIDIKNAFVQSDLAEEIYMQQPPGYEDGTGAVLLLNKSLYGLKQAPRVWHQTLTTHLSDLGCIQSPSDGALFTFDDSGGSPVYFLLYIDDIQIASVQLSRVAHFKKALLKKFPGRDLGESEFFLQMSIQRDRSRRLVVLKQQRHVEKLVGIAGTTDANPVSLPMIPTVYRDVTGIPVEPSAITQYKSLLGAMMHISNYTRPDIAFAVAYLARFVNAPTTDKFAVFSRIMDLSKIHW